MCNYPGEREYQAVFAYAYLPGPGEHAPDLLQCGLRSDPVPMPPAAVHEGSHPVTGPPPPDDELLPPLLPGRTMVGPSSPPPEAPELEPPPLPPSSPPVAVGTGVP